jgi:hypothetical protein
VAIALLFGHAQRRRRTDGNAGNLTGMTANTACGIRSNKSVHWLPFYYSDIHQGSRCNIQALF